MFKTGERMNAGLGNFKLGCYIVCSDHFRIASGMRLESFQMSAVLFICILEISFSRPGFLSPVTYLMVPQILEPILRASGFALLKKRAVPKSSVQFLPLEVL